MRWGENWRLYLTPGDGLLISLLEEFLSKSVSFINDISLCSVRHLLSSQKGNYLFRPGNNISYCLSSRARKGAKRRRRREKHRAEGSCPQTDGCQGPLSLQAVSFPHAKRACARWMWVSVCMYECVCNWGEETWDSCPAPLLEIANTGSLIQWASLSTYCVWGPCQGT